MWIRTFKRDAKKINQTECFSLAETIRRVFDRLEIHSYSDRAAYFLPFIFGIWVYYIPLGFPLGLITFMLLLGGFNFLRASKPECWMKNRLDAATDGWQDFRAPEACEFGRADWV